MKIDSIVKEFVESYDREVMEHIEKLSNDYALGISKFKFDIFNINESFNKMKLYLDGYKSYKVENVENEEAISNEEIMEAANRFIADPSLFEESKIPYSEIPNFIKGYIEGFESLKDKMEEVKTELVENCIDQESIGQVNDIVESFTEVVCEKFEPIMEKIVRASGYTTKKNLQNIKPSDKKVIL